MKFNAILSLMALSLMVVSCGEKKKEITQEPMVEESAQTPMEEETAPNIVEVAAGNSDFSTLVAAVKAADLVETLSSDGPFTVFAPINDAFSKLPEGTVENLIKPENKETLTGILTYHVVSGKYDAAAVVEAINANDGTFTVPTVQGGDIELSLVDGNVTLTDVKGGTSTVVMADVAASNGIIHALDAVVMPE